MEFLQELLPEFDNLFAKQAAEVTVVAPGRMNLIGEHTDYNGGKVLPLAINKTITLKALSLPATAMLDGFRLQPGMILIKSVGFENILKTNWSLIMKLAMEKSMASSLLPEALAKSWATYAVGALYKVLSLCADTHDLALAPPLLIRIKSDLPAGAGISSSAALSTGLISLLARKLEISLDPAAVARLAMEIEHQFAGTKCGLMDQLAVLLAEKDHLLHVDFRGFPSHGSFDYRHVRLHPIYRNYEFVGLNTGVKHHLADSPYNERRSACESMVHILNDYFKATLDSLGAYSQHRAFLALRNADYLPQGKVKKLLQESVLKDHQQRDTYAAFAAHAICENNRVDLACQALEDGRVELLDQMMNEGHTSLDLDYAVSCVELNFIRDEAQRVARRLAHSTGSLLPIIGGRMTGGGFGGSVIQLVLKDLVAPLAEHFSRSASEYQRQTGIQPAVLVTSAASGLTISE